MAVIVCDSFDGRLLHFAHVPLNHQAAGSKVFASPNKISWSPLHSSTQDSTWLQPLLHQELEGIQDPQPFGHGENGLSCTLGSLAWGGAGIYSHAGEMSIKAGAAVNWRSQLHLQNSSDSLLANLLDTQHTAAHHEDFQLPHHRRIRHFSRPRKCPQAGTRICSHQQDRCSGISFFLGFVCINNMRYRLLSSQTSK